MRTHSVIEPKTKSPTEAAASGEGKNDQQFKESRTNSRPSQKQRTRKAEVKSFGSLKE